LRKISNLGSEIFANDQGQLANNRILGNGFPSIGISTSTTPTIEDNHISWNGFGIMAHHEAGGIISNNDLLYNRNGAFYISEDSAANLKRSGTIEWTQSSFN